MLVAPQLAKKARTDPDNKSTDYPLQGFEPCRVEHKTPGQRRDGVPDLHRRNSVNSRWVCRYPIKPKRGGLVVCLVITHTILHHPEFKMSDPRHAGVQVSLCPKSGKRRSTWPEQVIDPSRRKDVRIHSPHAQRNPDIPLKSLKSLCHSLCRNATINIVRWTAGRRCMSSIVSMLKSRQLPRPFIPELLVSGLALLCCSQGSAVSVHRAGLWR